MSQELLQLPFNEEAERNVLGACLISSNALIEAGSMLTPSDFYSPKRKEIFSAMLAMSRAGQIMDSVTLGDWLETTGKLKSVGGYGGVAEQIEAVGSASNIVSHSKIVREFSMRREIILLTIEMADGARNMKDPAIVAANAQSRLLSLVYGRDSREWKSGGEAAIEGLEWMQKAAAQTSSITGIPTGLREIDRLTGGWQRGELVVVGARPSMGKTALATVTGTAAAREGFVVGMFSLEMSAMQLGLRFISRDSRTSIFQMRQPRGLKTEDWQFIQTAVEGLQPLMFMVDDTPLMTLDAMRAKARALKSRMGLDLIIIDYLQLMELDKGNRQAGLTECSRGLKLLSKELDLTIIALSQLSRECEKRDDKRPILSDLRESGAIEQDADMVIMLYRDEVYNDESTSKGVAEIIIRKQRNGPIDDARVAFQGWSASFENMPETA